MIPAIDPTNLISSLCLGTPFALIRREGRDEIEVFRGQIEIVETLADIPLSPTGDTPQPGEHTLALVPYRHISERGFDAVDDHAPLMCLRVTQRAAVSVADMTTMLPDEAPAVTDGGFDVDDTEYAETVRRVIDDEIGRGEGSNFVIHRAYQAMVVGDPLAAALVAFGRLLRDERGAYWTFCVHTGDQTFVGATPERHVSVQDGMVVMNPISGTYRHPADGPDKQDFLRFLTDQKEVDELYMVLDEELKMMATVADLGGRVVGPFLKQMSHLTHTEYLLKGRGDLDVREVLRRTMFAPTVVGSPIENACRVIARHEGRGRGYYAGVLALLGYDSGGRQTLDAPILIRCAQFDNSGRLRVPVGATLVRHSTPAGEVAETHTKARGVLSALGLGKPRSVTATARLSLDDEIHDTLAQRNKTLAGFWLHERKPDAAPLAPQMVGKKILIVDAEDTFTGMLVHQSRALGLTVTLSSYRDKPTTHMYDLVIAGPGPGDPSDPLDEKMGMLRTMIRGCLDSAQPLIGICLGHQVLASVLGLPLIRKESPYQGTQREIDFFGAAERVGFYSTFTAVAQSATVATPYGVMSVSRDPGSGEVHALQGPTCAGLQFHPESILSENGIYLLRDVMTQLWMTPYDSSHGVSDAP